MSRRKPALKKSKRPETIIFRVTNKAEIQYYKKHIDPVTGEADKDKAEHKIITGDFEKENLNFIYLERSFFLYGYNPTIDTEWRSGEYQYNEQSIRIYENREKLAIEGKKNSKEVKDFISENNLSVGMNLYALQKGTNEISRIEITASGRTIFFQYCEANKAIFENQDSTDFSILGFREATKEETEKGGLSSKLPIFEVFKPEEEEVTKALELCEAIDIFFGKEKPKGSISGEPGQISSGDDLPV